MLGYWPYATHKKQFYIFVKKKHYLSQQSNANTQLKLTKHHKNKFFTRGGPKS
jgi:hypothetical protein